MRVLIVDDAGFIRDMIKSTLRESFADAQLLDAVDGTRAVAALKSGPVDLILSDWEMPGMTGEEFLRWVRTQDIHKKTPFVMVTSRGDRDHVMKAVQAGVSDFLSKPFTPDELLRKVLKQMKKAGINPNLKSRADAGGAQGHAFGSIEALTGGNSGSKVVNKPANAKPENTMPAAFAKKSSPPVKKPASTLSKQSRAQLRFAGGSYECAVKDLSLQAINGVIRRNGDLPKLFDQAVVDIVNDNEQDIARLNGYVHSLQAVENSVNADSVKLIIRFVDNDPEKFEFLSKYIAKHR